MPKPRDKVKHSDPDTKDEEQRLLSSRIESIGAMGAPLMPNNEDNSSHDKSVWLLLGIQISIQIFVLIPGWVSVCKNLKRAENDQLRLSGVIIGMNSLSILITICLFFGWIRNCCCGKAIFNLLSSFVLLLDTACYFCVLFLD